MAENSLSMILQSDGTTKDTLSEQWGYVIDNFNKSTVSQLFKNTQLSGEPTAGVLQAKRFANAVAKAYGTARAGGAAQGIQVKPVTVNIDDDKEWLEEVEEKDLLLYGVDSIISRRTQNQGSGIRRYFERKFFNTAVVEGTLHSFTASDVEDKLEEIIQKLETLNNDFVDGVERDMMVLVLRPSIYGQAREYIDSLQNANVTSAVGEFGQFHGVTIISSVYLPATVDYLIMANGSVAQPIRLKLQNPEKIQFSEATCFGAFTYSGTTAVAPDMIFFAGTLGAVTATSAAGTAGTKTKIAVASSLSDPANDFYYLTGASAVAAPTYGTAVGTTWTKLVLTAGEQELTTGTHTKIRVAEADAAGRIIKVTGEITVVYGE